MAIMVVTATTEPTATVASAPMTAAVLAITLAGGHAKMFSRN